VNAASFQELPLINHSSTNESFRAIAALSMKESSIFSGRWFYFIYLLSALTLELLLSLIRGVRE
jgi:hypothetical protein